MQGGKLCPVVAADFEEDACEKMPLRWVGKEEVETDETMDVVKEYVGGKV